jgi:hypothetical protein
MRISDPLAVSPLNSHDPCTDPCTGLMMMGGDRIGAGHEGRASKGFMDA